MINSNKDSLNSRCENLQRSSGFTVGFKYCLLTQETELELQEVEFIVV